MKNATNSGVAGIGAGRGLESPQNIEKGVVLAPGDDHVGLDHAIEEALNKRSSRAVLDADI